MALWSEQTSSCPLPATTLTASQDIRIIQFIHPLILNNAKDPIPWEVDRRGTSDNPYYGWASMNEVNLVPSTDLSVTMGMLASMVNKHVAQKGSVSSRAAIRAYILDFVREPKKLPPKPQIHRFRVRYYELEMAFRSTVGLCVECRHHGKPAVTLLLLEVRTKSAPTGVKEKDAARKWNIAKNGAGGSVPPIT